MTFIVSDDFDDTNFAQRIFRLYLSLTVKGSHISPSDFHQPLKSIHHTSLGALACICCWSLGQSEENADLIFLGFTNPALSKIRFTVDNDGVIFSGYLRA